MIFAGGYLGLLVAACEKPLQVRQLPAAKQAVEVEPEEAIQRREFDRLLQLLQADRPSEAQKGFAQFVVSYPKSRLTDDAYYQLGLIHMQGKRFQEAVKAFQTNIERFPTADTVALSKYQYGVAYYRLNAIEQALPLLETVKLRRLPDEFRLSFLELLRRGYQQTEEKNKLVVVDLELLEIKPTSSELQDEVLRLINEDLQSETVERLVSRRGDDFPSGYMLMRLARDYFQQGHFNRAKDRLRTFLTRFRDRGKPHEQTKAAEILYDRLQRLDQVRANRIGILLPLSGGYAKVGRRILNGVLLASEIFSEYTNDTDELQLIIGDTASTEAGAQAAIDELVLDQQVIGVMGPVLKKTSLVAAKAADLYRVPMVVMSQDEEVAQTSPFIFQNCLRKSDQVESLARFLVEDMQVKRLAMLYPQHNYGEEMFWLMWRALQRYPEVQVVGVESYEKDDDDFGDEIRRLVGLFYLRPRSHELCGEKEQQDCFERSELPPIVDFEALFIPDAAEKVRQIAPALSYYGVRGVQLFGGNLWHTQQLLEKDTVAYMQGAIFVDGFYPDSPEPAVRSFVERYRQTFKEEPDILSAQAFDTMKILLQAKQQGRLEQRGQLKRFLQRVSTYQGATGMTAFQKSGAARRQIYYFMVDGRKIRPLIQ